MEVKHNRSVYKHTRWMNKILKQVAYNNEAHYQALAKKDIVIHSLITLLDWGRNDPKTERQFAGHINEKYGEILPNTWKNVFDKIDDNDKSVVGKDHHINVYDLKEP